MNDDNFFESAKNICKFVTGLHVILALLFFCGGIAWFIGGRGYALLAWMIIFLIVAAVFFGFLKAVEFWEKKSDESRKRYFSEKAKQSGMTKS